MLAQNNNKGRNARKPLVRGTQSQPLRHCCEVQKECMGWWCGQYGVEEECLL